MNVLTLALAGIVVALVVAILAVRHRQRHPQPRAMVHPIAVRDVEQREWEILQRLDAVFAHTQERQEHIIRQQRTVMEQLRKIRTGERDGDDEEV
jgi:LPS O-antigen subunit length determinant protein (WzzB/FepE family)